MLIKMELSFSELAALSGWPFVVAVLKNCFFSSFFFFPKQLRGSHPSTLESRCYTGDVYTGSAS